MKNIILILLLVFVTFYAIHLLDYKKPYAFDTVQNIDVSENRCEIQLVTTKKITNKDKWFYDYEIKENNLYITTYQVVNPLAKGKGISLEIHIEKGYDDFMEIYINGENEMKKIWAKKEER